MPRPKLSPDARRNLQRHRRDLQRRSANDAANRLSNARRELEKGEFLESVVASATNENAFFTNILSMINAVKSSWNLNLPISLRGDHWQDEIVAYTDFEKIEINYPPKMIPRSRVGGFDPLQLRTSIADIKGIAYHEIGHNLFTTPFPVLVELAVEEGLVLPSDAPMGALRDSWNVLEDQRMEAAIVRESPIMVDYLTTMVLNHIVLHSRYGTTTQWLLLTGRRYIPRHVRIEMKKEFANTYGIDLERRGTEIVRSYMAATTASEMLSQVLKFHDYFKEVGLSVPPTVDRHPVHTYRNGDNDTHKERITVSASDPGEDEPDDDASDPSPSADKSDQNDKSDKQEDKGDQPSDKGDTDVQSSDGDGDEGEDPGDSPPSTQGKAKGDQPGESDDTSRETANANQGDGASREGGEDMRDYIKRMAEEANAKRLEDSSLDATVRDIYTATADELALPKNRDTNPMWDDNMAGQALTLAQRLEESLHMYMAETAPIWQHRQTRGVIDPFAYRTKSGASQEYRRLYDNGDMGNDMAVTVLLDVSGSMHGSDDALGACAYATKAACMALDIPCTITTFSHDSEILWTAQDSPELLAIRCNGGTNPSGVLDALEFFSYDKATHLIVVMTDGMFDGTFKGFNPHKIGNRYFLGLGYGNSTIVEGLERAGVDEAHPITNLMDIPQVVSNFIATRVH